MSAHKKKGVVAAKSSGIVVGDGKHHWRVKLQAKMWGLLLGCIVALAALGFAGVKIHNHFAGSNDKSTQPPVVRARVLSETGNYAAAEKVISQQIDAAQTAQAKAGWYIQAYSVAMNNQQYQAALGYAQKAYQLAPSSGVAYPVAQAYEKLKDSTNARKYLQITIDGLDKTAQNYQIKLKQYQAEMAGL